MGGTIGADQAAAIKREHDRQILYGDVVDQLVVAALQERGVNCHHRPHPICGQSCGERHCVLLSNGYIEIASRKFL